MKSLGLSIDDVGQPQLQKRLEEVEISKLSQETGVGEPTLVDIIDALISPERDMRDELPKPLLKKGILKLEDLKRGMELEGTVRNVVDVGVKQDGLVHISKLSKQFVKHPLDVVSVGQIVKVWVDDIDTKRTRCTIYVAD